MLDASVTACFAAGPGYLNTASVGLPARATMAALRRAHDAWEAGLCDPVGFDADVDRSRRAFARLAGTDAANVALIGQVSTASGLVASSLPDGATVVCAEEDFTSVLFPFLVDERLKVRMVPLDALVDEIGRGTDLVAVSAVQSADGRVLDLDRLADAAADVGARTYVDATQAAGWLRLDTDRFDVTATGAYKWLCAPRGTGFLTVAPQAEWLIPRHAGWYAGDQPWESIYGPPLRLAADARRFNVSPPWFDVVGTAPALELLADLGVKAVGSHSVALANHFRAGVGLGPSDSAIVRVPTAQTDAAAAAFREAGVAAAVRAGGVRLSFYVYNTLADADLAADVVRSVQQ
ncbi:MAG: aminotransferase class V-fold PLP-dependent enzyme [Microthrixaceae bacterium]